MHFKVECTLDDSQKIIDQESKIDDAKQISINTNKLHTFSETNIENSVKHVFIDANKTHHLFGQTKHNLHLLSKTHNQEQIIREVLGQLSGKISFNGTIKDMIVNIGGYEVYVRGRIMDGILKISSLFIKII